MAASARVVPLILLTATFLVSEIHGQGAPQRGRAASVGGAPALKVGESIDDSDFARWAFGKPWDVEATRSQLDSRLKRKIKAIDAVCELTDAQRQKLDLAGRGDIRKLLDRIEEIRSEFGSARSDAEKLQKLHERLQPIKSSLTARLFGHESLFAKTFTTVVTDGQKIKYDQRGSRAGNQTISVDNCVSMVPISALPKSVYQIAWRRDGAQAAFVSAPFDRAVEILQLPDYEVVRTIGADKKPVGFEFSPDENIVALADNSQNAFIINVSTGREIPIQTANQQPAVCFSPDGKWLVTGGYGTDAQLWETDSGELVRTFPTGHEKGGLRAIFSPDGDKVAVGNRNSTTCLFDVASGRLIHRLGKNMSQGLQFDPTGKVLAVTYVDATLGLWDVASGNLIRSVKTQAGELYSVDWSPDGTLLLTAGRAGQVTLWDPRDLSILVELESPEWVITARFTPDGKKLLFSGGGVLPKSVRQVEIWGVP